jgi:proteasome lid subunit RPN8/RPN11
MVVLCIDSDRLRELEDQAKKNYPVECCGLLLGTNTSEKKVVEVCPVPNMNTERTHDRYEIEGKVFIGIDREAAKKGLQIIGIYHSHPDHPAIPSVFDTDHAWSGYSYMIAAIKNGTKVEIRSWVFDEEKKKFEEEKIHLC